MAEVEEKAPSGLAETEIAEVIKDTVTDSKKELELAEARTVILKARLKSRTIYPIETRQAWMMELKAIDRGMWKPGWRPPKRMTPYDQFMNA